MMNFTKRSFNNLKNSQPVDAMLKKILPLLSCLFFSFGLCSCEQELSMVGGKLMPSTDYIDVLGSDTIATILSYTMRSDSVETTSPATSYLGSYYDPYFGTLTADFVSQIRLGSSWEGGGYVIDSVNLYLSLLTTDGDVEGPHYLTLSEIDEELSTDATVQYFSNREVTHAGYYVTNLLMPQDLRTDTINDVVVKVPISFGEYLLRDTTKLFYELSDTLETSDFDDYFKGLHFQLNSPEGKDVMFSLSIDAIDIYDSYSNYFAVYLHSPEGTSKIFYFYLDALTQNGSYNRYLFDYSTADPLTASPRLGMSYLDTLSYLQRMNGLHTRLALPGIQDLRQYLIDNDVNNISVNRARIVVPYVTDDIYYTNTNLPSVSMRYISTTGDKYTLTDYIFDGTADTTNQVYNFNIATFLQYYIEQQSFDELEGDTQPVFELYLSTEATNNLILKANGNSDPPKFLFSYSLF